MGAAAAVSSVEWGECLVPPAAVPREMEAEVRRVVGGVPGWLPRLAPCPWLVNAATAFVRRPIAFAPLDLCDLVSLTVSQDNSCRYCYGAQRAILRIHGFGDEYIDRLVRDFHVADLSPAERAALDFARRVTRADPRPGRGEFEAVVRAGMPREAVLEVAAVVASSNFANRWATLLALPSEPLEQMVMHPLFRFVRPLVSWRMRRRHQEPATAPISSDGPCARVVGALGRSPSARVFRDIIDAAWGSGVLPGRTKTLMLGVVGKVLGCRHTEDETRSLLAREGFSPSELDDVFNTLGSSRLDACEARLVPFARETVRYQPIVIQRRLREVARGFSAEEILETVGVLALANAVCRLSTVLDAC